MKSARPTYLSISLTFVAAIVFYFAAYSWMTARQTGKGPWQVVFTNDAAGVPELVIAQPGHGISNVHIQFLEEHLAATQHAGVVGFAKPHLPVPFGELIYDDLMFLPGTVTLDCFGHEVELLPRVLVLDRKEVPWTNNSAHALSPSSKLPLEVRRKTKGGYRR